MPSVAVLATAVLVLGPGRERPAIGARIWGVPAEGATAAVWRIETIERQFGSDQTIAVPKLAVLLRQAGRPLSLWGGSSGDDGVAEARMASEAPLAGTIDIEVRSDRTLLAAGTLALRPVNGPAFERRVVQGRAEGAITLDVSIERGVLASPFFGAIRVRATRDGQPAALVTLRAAGEGAQIFEPGLLPATDQTGEATIGLQPTWHSIELHLDASQGQGDTQAKGTWDGTLPVKPGALWLSSAPSGPALASPAPRARAYVSGWSAKGRVFGVAVPLSISKNGFYEGDLPKAELSRLGVLAVTVSGDVSEQSPGTVIWPWARLEAVAWAPRVELMLDGVPFAEKLEKKRAGQARLASVGVAVLAAIIEAVLLVLYSRASHAKLAAHLAANAEGDDERAAASRMTASPASRTFTLVVAVGLVLLAFGAVAVFAIVR